MKGDVEIAALSKNLNEMETAWIPTSRQYEFLDGIECLHPYSE
jgi:hypothetical protein